MAQCLALNTSMAAAQENLQSAGIHAVKEARDMRLYVVQLERREVTSLQADLGLTVHKSDRASYQLFVTHPRKLLHTHQVACQPVYITASSLSWRADGLVPAEGEV